MRDGELAAGVRVDACACVNALARIRLWGCMHMLVQDCDRACHAGAAVRIHEWMHACAAMVHITPTWLKVLARAAAALGPAALASTCMGWAARQHALQEVSISFDVLVMYMCHNEAAVRGCACCCCRYAGCACAGVMYEQCVWW